LLLSILLSAQSMRGESRHRQIFRSRFDSDLSTVDRMPIGSSRSTIRTTPPPFTVRPGFWPLLSKVPPPSDPHQFVRYYPVWKRLNRSP
ncbi:hypothetical protein PMAYCL1PPCAC_02550, partial [Pristionchus mayeri]